MTTMTRTQALADLADANVQMTEALVAMGTLPTDDLAVAIEEQHMAHIRADVEAHGTAYERNMAAFTGISLDSLKGF